MVSGLWSKTISSNVSILRNAVGITEILLPEKSNLRKCNLLNSKNEKKKLTMKNNESKY